MLSSFSFSCFHNDQHSAWILERIDDPTERWWTYEYVPDARLETVTQWSHTGLGAAIDAEATYAYQAIPRTAPLGGVPAEPFALGLKTYTTAEGHLAVENTFGGHEVVRQKWGSDEEILVVVIDDPGAVARATLPPVGREDDAW